MQQEKKELNAHVLQIMNKQEYYAILIVKKVLKEILRCLPKCPEGFNDDGEFCRKPNTYARGSGFIDEKTCKSGNKQGCEKNGILFFPKCKNGFHNVGAAICTADCPKGMTDIGVSCQKSNAYMRGAGKPCTMN